LVLVASTDADDPVSTVYGLDLDTQPAESMLYSIDYKLVQLEEALLELISASWGGPSGHC
jgi:hypothetical protein